MKKLTIEAKRLMVERFGMDNVIALATLEDGRPCVRYVNAPTHFRTNIIDNVLCAK